MKKKENPNIEDIQTGQFYRNNQNGLTFCVIETSEVKITLLSAKGARAYRKPEELVNLFTLTTDPGEFSRSITEKEKPAHV